MKRIAVLMAALVVATCPAWAGDTAAKAKAANPAMDSMMAEMMKCSVCKHMAAHMTELAPVLSAEVVTLDNGMAVVHTVSDPKKVEIYHTASTEMSKAGEACMAMTDEQAKTELCPLCQEMRSVAKAGAQISSGLTKNGDILVVTSSDPALKPRIAGLQEKCEMLMAKKG